MKMPVLSLLFVVFGFSTTAFADFESSVKTLAAYAGEYQKHAAQSHEVDSMLREYAHSRYENSNLDLQLEVKINSEQLEVNGNAVGTITAKEAAMQALANIPSEDISEQQYNSRKAEISQAIQDLQTQGAVFGFDAVSQNACATASPFLLVLNTKSAVIYGVELQPCHE